MYIIGLDDGHGKETSGKQTPDGYKENEFNHFTKIYLAEYLEYNGFKVVDCSPSREDNSLKERCNIANKNKCDLFISIHFNAMGNRWQTNVGGIETYHYPHSTEGRKLATFIHQELMNGTAMTDRGVKSANFYVLHHTDMPAVLAECGFMDNRREAILMKSSEYRKECSREICKGICNYFNVKFKDIPKPEQKNYLYIIQAGAYSEKTNAEIRSVELKEKGISNFIKVVEK